MQENGQHTQTPDRRECWTDAPNEQGRHGKPQWDAALGRPLEPVVVRLVGEGSLIDNRVTRVYRRPSSESTPGPRPVTNHLHGGERKLAPERHRIRSPKPVPHS